MSSSSFRFLFLSGLISFWLFAPACNKYEDPPPAEDDPRLDNPYCNDPGAVNYNWGFPGTPDSSTCIYPVDSFLGSWLLQDTVYFSDQAYDTVTSRLISIQVVSGDSLKNRLEISGWCGQEQLLATANKFGRADLDSIGEGVDGQIICSAADTLSGFLSLNHFRNSDTFFYEFNRFSADGHRIHKGFGVRQ